MQRRSFLWGASAAACPICAGLVGRNAVASEEAPHWSYAGSTGPADWGSLSPDYATCSSGTAQSPIDLGNAFRGRIPPTDIAWHAVDRYGVVNNGHTIQVNVPPGSSITLLDNTYSLLQFHFHHASEHTIHGEHFPLEAHFVHQAGDGSLSVVGVLFEDGPENPELVPIWDVMPTEPGEVDVAGRRIDPNGLLPPSRSAYLYYGSLTTPPCSETVTWLVLSTPMSASAAQIDDFDAVFRANYRPVQSLNRRLLLLGG